MLLSQSGQLGRVVFLGMRTSNVRCAVIPRPRQFPISLWLVRNHQNSAYSRGFTQSCNFIIIRYILISIYILIKK
jgi:hypothetical protein